MLGKVAFSLMVPVLLSTVLSINVSWPVAVTARFDPFATPVALTESARPELLLS